MKIQDELLMAKWLSRYTGPDYESNWGFKSAIQFCLDKREEGWTLQEFIDNRNNLIEEYRNVEGPYKDGYLYGLKLNIKEFNEESVTNE
ncbi:MAG: hypothetical protein RR942_15020 [Romboutsia sp.]